MSSTYQLINNLTASPSDYPTWVDALEIFPNLTGDATAENLFNLFLASVKNMVDQGLCGEYTFILSFCLTMHFMSVLWDGGKAAVFDADEFTGTSGAVTSVEAEKVSVKFEGGAQRDAWESDLSQSEFGQIYLDMVKVMRAVVGIQGGNLWASV